jgi:SAM-dependent methyltransferase
LDAGCGAATYARYLARHGAFVIAADYSPLTVLKAKKRASEGVEFVIADIQRLPLPSRVVVGALCFGVTQSLSTSAEAVNELRRCLVPGGELWIDGLNRYCVPNVWQEWRRRLTRKPAHLRYEGPWALKRTLESAGLLDVRLHWMPIVPGRFARLQSLVESAPARFALKYLPPLSSLISHAFILTGRSR